MNMIGREQEGEIEGEKEEESVGQEVAEEEGEIAVIVEEGEVIVGEEVVIEIGVGVDDVEEVH